jgi:hypothetical protein
MLENGKVVSSSSKFSKWFLATTFAVLLLFVGTWQSYLTEESTFRFISWNGHRGASNFTALQQTDLANNKAENVMEILQQNGVYETSDFINEFGIVPPYWINGSTPIHPIETKSESVGPCFLSNTPVRWNDTVEQNRYPTSGVGLNKNDWANYCLPGFLIIGAGKCGTSVSLWFLLQLSTQSMNWYLYLLTNTVLISML